MKTTRKLIGAAAATGLLLFAYSADESLTDAMFAVLDVDTTVSTAEHVAAITSADAIARGEFGFESQTAESVSWVTETDSEIAFAQVDSQFGPPVADNVDDDAQERKTPR
ncbi:MAG: hypothetical protein ACR2RD_08635, partial [Woeseiaceae bacterium]